MNSGAPLFVGGPGKPVHPPNDSIQRSQNTKSPRIAPSFGGECESKYSTPSGLGRVPKSNAPGRLHVINGNQPPVFVFPTKPVQNVSNGIGSPINTIDQSMNATGGAVNAEEQFANEMDMEQQAQTQSYEQQMNFMRQDIAQMNHPASLHTQQSVQQGVQQGGLSISFESLSGPVPPMGVERPIKAREMQNLGQGNATLTKLFDARICNVPKMPSQAYEDFIEDMLQEVDELKNNTKQYTDAEISNHLARHFKHSPYQLKRHIGKIVDQHSDKITQSLDLKVRERLDQLELELMSLKEERNTSIMNYSLQSANSNVGEELDDGGYMMNEASNQGYNHMNGFESALPPQEVPMPLINDNYVDTYLPQRNSEDVIARLQIHSRNSKQTRYRTRQQQYAARGKPVVRNRQNSNHRQAYESDNTYIPQIHIGRRVDGNGNGRGQREMDRQRNDLFLYEHFDQNGFVMEEVDYNEEERGELPAWKLNDGEPVGIDHSFQDTISDKAEEEKESRYDKKQTRDKGCNTKVSEGGKKKDTKNTRGPKSKNNKDSNDSKGNKTNKEKEKGKEPVKSKQVEMLRGSTLEGSSRGSTRGSVRSGREERDSIGPEHDKGASEEKQTDLEAVDNVEEKGDGDMNLDGTKEGKSVQEGMIALKDELEAERQLRHSELEQERKLRQEANTAHFKMEQALLDSVQQLTQKVLVLQQGIEDKNKALIEKELSLEQKELTLQQAMQTQQQQVAAQQREQQAELQRQQKQQSDDIQQQQQQLKAQIEEQRLQLQLTSHKVHEQQQLQQQQLQQEQEELHALQQQQHAEQARLEAIQRDQLQEQQELRQNEVKQLNPMKVEELQSMKVQLPSENVVPGYPPVMTNPSVRPHQIPHNDGVDGDTNYSNYNNDNIVDNNTNSSNGIQMYSADHQEALGEVQQQAYQQKKQDEMRGPAVNQRGRHGAMLKAPVIVPSIINPEKEAKTAKETRSARLRRESISKKMAKFSLEEQEHLDAMQSGKPLMRKAGSMEKVRPTSISAERSIDSLEDYKEAVAAVEGEKSTDTTTVAVASKTDSEIKRDLPTEIANEASTTPADIRATGPVVVIESISSKLDAELQASEQRASAPVTRDPTMTEEQLRRVIEEEAQAEFLRMKAEREKKRHSQADSEHLRTTPTKSVESDDKDPSSTGDQERSALFAPLSPDPEIKNDKGEEKEKEKEKEKETSPVQKTRRGSWFSYFFNQGHPHHDDQDDHDHEAMHATLEQSKKRGTINNSEREELVAKLASLKEEKDVKKQKLKRWESDFKKREGHEPTVVDKETVKELFIDYHDSRNEYNEISEKIKAMEE